MYRRVVLGLGLGGCLIASAHTQTPVNGTQRLPDGEILDRLLQRNVLTWNGNPFHAVMQITEEHGDPSYKGSVEVFWAGPKQYRLHVSAPAFEQTLTVNGERTQERDQGDFYPNWLQNFVTALLDPLPRAADLRGRGATASIGPDVRYSCLKRDDRPGNITDQKTWASVCFSGPKPDLEFAIDFTYNMEFHDLDWFGDKRVARSYVNGAGDRARIHGILSTVETWKPDPALLTVERATPPQERITTTFVSTAQGESLLEKAPQEVHWPAVREGKTDGYVIVQAITDRTGQVRETSKHNSDNPELASFGREVALQYKFKPLVIDGVAQQMEMPLVLHFDSRQGNPLPEIGDAEARERVRGCNLPRSFSTPLPSGTQFIVSLRLDEDGRFTSFRSNEKNLPAAAIFSAFRGCRFGPFLEDGKPVRYRANLNLVAK